MSLTTNPYTMGIKDIQVRRAGTTVALPAAQKMSVKPLVVSGTLRGSGRIVAANSYIEGAEVTFGAGGIPLAALAVMFGITLPSPTGSTPNQVRTMPVPASQALPYFEVMGRVQDADGGDLHIYIPRCKIMGGFDLQLQDGANFAAPEMQATCVPDEATNQPFIFYQYETSTAIAFPTATSVALTDIDVLDNIATATSGSAHGFSAGQWITISGVSAEYVNGSRQVIAVPTSTSFTFVAFGADVSNLTGVATKSL